MLQYHHFSQMHMENYSLPTLSLKVSCLQQLDLIYCSKSINRKMRNMAHNAIRVTNFLISITVSCPNFYISAKYRLLILPGVAILIHQSQNGQIIDYIQDSLEDRQHFCNWGNHWMISMFKWSKWTVFQREKTIKKDSILLHIIPSQIKRKRMTVSIRGNTDLVTEEYWAFKWFNSSFIISSCDFIRICYISRRSWIKMVG